MKISSIYAYSTSNTNTNNMKQSNTNKRNANPIQILNLKQQGDTFIKSKPISFKSVGRLVKNTDINNVASDLAAIGIAGTPLLAVLGGAMWDIKNNKPESKVNLSFKKSGTENKKVQQLA